MTRYRILRVFPLCVALAASPAMAEDPPGDEGRSLMQEGARLFLEGIRREMGPALDSLRGQAEEMEPALRRFVEQMGPALRDLMEQAGDLSAYHAPEILPNGDIILRRKAPDDAPDDAPRTPLPDAAPGAPQNGEIDI